MNPLANKILKFFTQDNQLLRQLEHTLGFKPKHLPYYQIALTHRSMPDSGGLNNERLEFLGDAILGAIMADFLFKKYPAEDEGFLTELRSKIVCRETLNDIAARMGIPKLVVYNYNDKNLPRGHIFGNALEALIGAVYLDQGFLKTKNFILKEIIKTYVDVEKMAQTNNNFKNQLLSWAQKNSRAIRFEIINQQKEGHRKTFTVGLFMDEELISSGTAFNKKDAGQVAAKEAIKKLDIPKIS